MRRLAGSGIRALLRTLGVDIVPYRGPYPPDFDPDTVSIIQRVKPFTMTSDERLFSLCRAAEYIVRHDIPGEVVECGVWKGGSMMAVALTLMRIGSAERGLFLFDTFEGMPPPGEDDRDFRGEHAARIMGRSRREPGRAWGYGPLSEVRRNIESTSYDPARVHYVEGRVEETIPDRAPPLIALLRLDTDWYGSTYHEMVHLYPRLSVGGVLIVDDYGHWEGARRAVDRYLSENSLRLLLHRVDYTARAAVKIEP